MSDTSTKLWSQDDIARALIGLYFANHQGKRSEEYAEGFAGAMAGISLMFGINPETFISAHDIQLLRRRAM